jgi:hypothetical protein
MNHGGCDVRKSRRDWPAGARIAAVIITAGGLALLAAACGGSPGSHVARLDSTTTQPADASSSPNGESSPSSRSLISQPLAFSHCMRSDGVPNFPDPNSNGVWPKSQVELAAGNPRFQAATHACGHLLPYGGPGVPPSPAVVQRIRTDMTKFARCMRAHGVPNWPDPTVDDQGRGNFDTQAAGINTNTPQINDNIHNCDHVYPASIGIPWSP